jgi:peptidoglycan L-alanyl-D-glutamate endopeptidase CwlK
MNRFSETSKAKLNTCHRDLQTLFSHVVQDYNCTVICGERGEAEQNKAFAEGKSKLKFPQSKHNHHPSLAVDVAPYEGNHIDWGKLQSAFFAGYVKGKADQLFTIGVISHRIRFGIDWDGDNDIDDTTFWDACHFEIIPNERDKFL